MFLRPWVGLCTDLRVLLELLTLWLYLERRLLRMSRWERCEASSDCFYTLDFPALKSKECFLPLAVSLPPALVFFSS